MKKIILIIILSLLLIAAALYLFYILPSEKELAAVRSMKIEVVDLQKVNDGMYEGDYSYGSYTYELAVSVKEHKIEKINVIGNRDTSHAKKAEGVISRVLEKQSANVDTVSSGA